MLASRVSAALAVVGALALPLGAAGAGNARKPLGKIAFTASPAPFGQGDLYTVRADGSHLRQLTDNPIPEQGAAWAPDGKSIAYIRLTGQGALYRLFLNGRKPRLLFKETGSARGFILDPAWSPDGRRIAFSSARSGTPAIWTVGLDGTLTQVTKTLSAHPTWSPNGRRLAYSGLGRDGHGKIFIVALDGSRKRDVSHAHDDGSPVWSPNGKWIALRSSARERKGEVGSLEIVNPAGTVRKRLLTGQIGPVAWSPQSDAILVGKRAGANSSQLFIVPLSGGRPRPVPGTNGVVGGASWHR